MEKQCFDFGKIMKTPIKYLALISFSFLLGCLTQTSKPYYLIQNYNIFCNKEKMQIEGNVYYKQFPPNNENKFKYPQKVIFNGSIMENNRLKRDYGKDPCENLSSETNDGKLGDAPELEKETDINEKSNFSFVQDKFQNTNFISVVDENGNNQMFEATFEPKEFATDEPLKLSRSKENVIQLKGKGGKQISFLIKSGQGDGFDEKTMKFDTAKNVLTISGKDLNKIKNRYATFLIQSSDTQPIPTQGIGSGNYYSIFFEDERCVEIVE